MSWLVHGGVHGCPIYMLKSYLKSSAMRDDSPNSHPSSDEGEVILLQNLEIMRRSKLKHV